jgi:hypothetical protein
VAEHHIPASLDLHSPWSRCSPFQAPSGSSYRVPRFAIDSRHIVSIVYLLTTYTIENSAL